MSISRSKSGRMVFEFSYQLNPLAICTDSFESFNENRKAFDSRGISFFSRKYINLNRNVHVDLYILRSESLFVNASDKELLKIEQDRAKSKEQTLFMLYDYSDITKLKAAFYFGSKLKHKDGDTNFYSFLNEHKDKFDSMVIDGFDSVSFIEVKDG